MAGEGARFLSELGSAALGGDGGRSFAAPAPLRFQLAPGDGAVPNRQPPGSGGSLGRSAAAGSLA